LKRFRAYLETKYRSVLSGEGIVPRHFTEFLESENLSGFSANTLQRRKMVLAQFAQYLTSIGEFTSDQVEEILGWRIGLWKDIYFQDVEYLSDRDVQAILGEGSGESLIRTARDKAIISILLETGLSISSVISLRLKDVDLTSKSLSPGTAGGFVHQIEMATPHLRKYLMEERADMVQSPTEEILFISQLGGPISRQGVWQILKTIGDRLSPPVRLAPRVLRNTAVKRMINEGLSNPEIQERLGHRNIYSTRALVRKIKRTGENQEKEND
jgi:integrase/recombinase XerD